MEPQMLRIRGSLSRGVMTFLYIVYAAFSFVKVGLLVLSKSWPMKDETEREATGGNKDNAILGININEPAIEAARIPLDDNEYLSTREATQIHERFPRIDYEPRGQVISREHGLRSGLTKGTFKHCARRWGLCS